MAKIWRISRKDKLKNSWSKSIENFSLDLITIDKYHSLNRPILGAIRSRIDKNYEYHIHICCFDFLA